MNENGVDLDGALDWVAEYHKQVLSEFQAQYDNLPSWGPTMDLKVKVYVERLAYFVRGIDCWAFETERYFGTKGLEVQGKRVVNLMPRAEAVTPMMAPGKTFDI
jgi:Delta6-protoilludene synthase